MLRLSRYRSARIGVDVNLHTGRWTFEQAVKYFMEGGRARSRSGGRRSGGRGFRARRRRSATSRANGRSCVCSAATATRQGADFRLGQFHDDLITNGSLPLSIVEWILLDDPTSLEQALR